MNASIIVALLFCVSMTTGFRISEGKKRADAEYFIQYVSAKGDVVAKQKVMIKNKEVQLQEGEVVAVLDYNKMLITMKDTPESKICKVIKIDRKDVPTFEEISQAIKEQQGKLKMPTRKMTLNVQRTKQQSPTELSPLSGQLCNGLSIQVFEPKTDEVSPRQNRDIGWGEVVVIIIVIIILF